MSDKASSVVTMRPDKIGPSSNMLTIIANAAADPSVDVAKMTALLELHERLLARDAKAEFNQALAKMNRGAEMRVNKEGEVRLSAGGRVSYKFAKWEDMDAVIRPLLQEHGFTLSFDTEIRANGIIVKGELLHEGGHSRTASIPLVIDSGPGRNANQAMGSTVSYGKRYTTEMLLNIVRVDEDDDGQAGGGSGGSRPVIHDVDERPDRRENSNAEAPIKPKGRSIRAVLDQMRVDLETAPTLAVHEAISNSEEAKKLKAFLKQRGQTELDDMIAATAVRFHHQEPPADEDIEREMTAAEDAISGHAETETVSLSNMAQPEADEGIYPLDEDGAPAIDETGEPLRFDTHKAFARWYRDYVQSSPHPELVKKNNNHLVHYAMSDAEASAILEPPPEQPRRRPAVSSLFVPVPEEKMPNGSLNWSQYGMTTRRKLLECWSPEMLVDFEAINSPTYGSTPAVVKRVNTLIAERGAALENPTDREMRDARELIGRIVSAPTLDALTALLADPAHKMFMTLMRQSRNDDIYLMIEAAEKTAAARLKQPSLLR